MDAPTPDSAEIERRLMQLTERQCQILFWVLHGLYLKEIGKKLGCGKRPSRRK